MCVCAARAAENAVRRSDGKRATAASVAARGQVSPGGRGGRKTENGKIQIIIIHRRRRDDRARGSDIRGGRALVPPTHRIIIDRRRRRGGGRSLQGKQKAAVHAKAKRR